MTVTLTGFMGCGKTTVGKALAESLGWDFIDLDAYIEHKKGCSVSEIFASEGEGVFRAIEAECIRDIVVMHQITGRDVVVALGGGTLSTHSIQNLILEQTFCIWLRRSYKSCLEEIGDETGSRPRLADGQNLFDSRQEDYSKAGHVIDCDGKSYSSITAEAAALVAL